MKDLLALAFQCMNELDELKIQYSTNIRWNVSDTFIRKWGQCEKRPDGTFVITVASRLLQDGVDDDALKTTIMHELLHTVDGCYNHGAKWKALAEDVHEHYGYKIKRTADFKDEGVEEIEPKFIIQCKKCGVQVKRYKNSRAIQRYYQYKCANCGGSFERIK